MEQETLFTSSKWDILKCLETGKKSPLELAKESNTSIANISQQLRLLELAGFVKSERIPNREKGLPRIVYSLTENYSYLVISSPGFVEKKFFKLQPYQKTIMKIWFIENTTLHSYIEKYYWSLEKQLPQIDLIAIDYSDTKSLKVLIASDHADIKKQCKDLTLDGEYGPKTFTITCIKPAEFKKQKSHHHIIYDPKLLGIEKEV